MPRFDREGAERYVCELLGDQGRCGTVFTSWTKYMAHQTHNKSGNHGRKSPLRVSVITNQCVNCGSTFADRPTAQNHVVSSWTTGTCRTERSHTTWALEEITLPISCNLSAQEFGDLQTYYTRARMTHLPFPAPAIRESTAQPAQQTRRHRQHSRNGHERGPTVRQKGRQQRPRGAAKAASTYRQLSQARKRNFRIDGSGGQAAQGRKQVRAEDPHQAATGWDTLLVKASSPKADNIQEQTQTYAEKARQEGPSGSAHLGLTAQGIAQPLQPVRTCDEVRYYRRDTTYKSRRQENHVENRVTGKTAPRSRSTQSNRGRSQVWTSATHSRGTRTTSIPGRSSDAVKIMVRAFLAEKRIQANSKAWHNAMQSEHTQRMAIAHQSSAQRTPD